MSENDPISYEVLGKGTPVVSTSGARIGTVEHVLQDASLDLFDGIAVTTPEGLRFVDADQVGTITAVAVHTTVTDAQIADLPRPDGDAVFEADPEEYEGPGLSAWFGRTFRREHWMRDRHGKGGD